MSIKITTEQLSLAHQNTGGLRRRHLGILLVSQGTQIPGVCLTHPPKSHNPPLADLS